MFMNKRFQSINENSYNVGNIIQILTVKSHVHSKLLNVQLTELHFYNL